VLYWLRLGGLDASWRVEGELLLLELGGAQPLVSEGLARVIGALARPLPSHMQRLAAQRWKTWQASQAQALPAYRLLDRLERQMLCSDSGPECPETPAPSVVRMLWLDAGPQPALNLDALLIGPFPNLAYPVSWQPFRPPPREAGHTLIEVGCRHADQARLLYLQGLSDQPAERAFWQLLHRLIAAPFFDELRTRQQLGYWVVARYHSLVGQPGLLLLVQSPDQSQERIRQAMDEFLLREERRLLDTDFARIAEQARVLAAGLRASALSADGRLEEAWQRCQGAAWPSRLPEADALEALTPEVWRKALDRFFLQAPRVALQSHQAD
jgi:insulysin